MGGITGPALAFWQAGSALISMARKTGGSPSNFTVPVIEPAVAESTIAVGGGGPEDSLDSFLLQPVVMKSVAHSARTADRSFKKTIPFS
jgi:hypothetical protein